VLFVIVSAQSCVSHLVCLRPVVVSAALELAEEARHVARHELRLLTGGEVAAARHLGPAPHVVEALGPLARRGALGVALVREDGDRRRDVDEVARADLREPIGTSTKSLGPICVSRRSSQ
jgi:hypothetical protein